jgi:uncharacterized protein with PQ loop repeat
MITDLLRWTEIEVETPFAFLAGSSTIFFSLMVKLIGELDQIRRSFTRKSTEGLSLRNYLLSFLAYCSWTSHGLTRSDPVILISQSLGVLVTSILLLQFLLYWKGPRGRKAWLESNMNESAS